MHRSWIAAAAVVLCSCGMSPEEEACNDLVDALVDLSVRCGDDEAVAREAYLELYRDCEVTAIRDEDELRADCIPGIGALTCEEVVEDPANALPESCRGQLLFD